MKRAPGPGILEATAAKVIIEVGQASTRESVLPTLTVVPVTDDELPPVRFRLLVAVASASWEWLVISIGR